MEFAVTRVMFAFVLLAGKEHSVINVSAIFVAFSHIMDNVQYIKDEFFNYNKRGK